MKEFFQLLYLRISIGFKNLFEFCCVVGKYYRNIKFAKADLTLSLCYLFRSPFRVSKRYWQKQGAEDVYVYGETPLTTLDKITTECLVTKDDVVYELGCGRGMTSFWLNLYKGCRTVGIEIIPEFVDKAKRIQWFYQCKKLEFRCQDILQTELFEATVVYLYGSNFDDIFLVSLTKKLSQLQPGTKVITVSYPITEYATPDTFEVMKRFPVKFPWGEADIYLQIRK